MWHRLLDIIQQSSPDVSAEEIADVLWLAARLAQYEERDEQEPQSAAGDSSSSSRTPMPRQPDVPPSMPPKPPTRSPEDIRNTREKPSFAPAEQERTPLYSGSGGQTGAGAGGMPFTTPGAPALPCKLDLARALRPLKRRVKSRIVQVFDEAATVRHSADGGLWLPMLCPADERWFDVALVVDETATMAVWQETIEELWYVLAHHGAFRDVRVWRMATDSDRKITHLAAGLRAPDSDNSCKGAKTQSPDKDGTVFGASSSGPAMTRVSELLAPGNPRLILVVSDCVSRGWQQGTVKRTLATWAKHHPVTIVQVLPDRLWSRTMLGLAPHVLLHTSSPGSPNAHYGIDSPRLRFGKAKQLLGETHRHTRLCMPVVTLEPQALVAWARMMTGDATVRLPGFVFDLSEDDTSNRETVSVSPSPLDTPLSNQERLDLFLATASPTARKLAGLLACACGKADTAPLTMDVIRLIQSALLPESKQVHLAEVFLGGLLQQLLATSIGMVQYAFHDGVRAPLQNMVPVPKTIDVLCTVGDYIGRRTGHPINFRAWLANPIAGDFPIGEAWQPFAALSAEVLAGMGGRFADVGGGLGGIILVGTNLGTIIYGRPPEEDEQQRLVRYLDALAQSLHRLPLQAIVTRLDEDGEGIALPAVYTLLATTRRVEVARGTQKEHDTYFEELGLENALLVSEAMQKSPHMVLLGDLGSGKSTVVRYMAWVLARHGLRHSEQDSFLQGWDANQPKLPIVQPLRLLARQLATESQAAGQQAVTTVTATLQTTMAGCDALHVDDILRESLYRGAAVIFFDGLDEVPPYAEPGVSVDRITTIQAIKAFSERYQKCMVVVTCRTRAFSDDLRDCLGWPVEELAPFTLGQVRHFVPAWYNELVYKKYLSPEQAQRYGDELLTAIQDTTRPRLREMAAIPLLLTMMAWIVCDQGRLPRDRPAVYEAVLTMLLEQWDVMREGAGLADVIGEPGWNGARLRPLLDRLSYEAHCAVTSTDGRGRLAASTIKQELERMFTIAGMSDDRAAAASVRCLHHIDQRIGLLRPDGDDYVFAHLTLQEHCAGRHLTRQRDAVKLVMQHRSDNRWREPIFLGLGVIQSNNPWLIEAVLKRLLEQREDGKPKPPARWLQDLFLANELGNDRDWNHLRDLGVCVEELQSDLRQGLVALLADPAQSLPVAERVRAGFILGDLGDPRVLQLETGNSLSQNYWCQIEQGTFWFGDDRKWSNLQQVNLPYNFQMSCYLVTNSEYSRFIDSGGYTTREFWTEEGWTWLQERKYTQPERFDVNEYNNPSQPVVGISWYEAAAYCHWLTLQGYERGWLLEQDDIRLPTSLEWERATRHTDQRSYPWGDEEPTTEHANYKDTRVGRPAPVGCFPLGASVCGALDMAGNVQEWTSTLYDDILSLLPCKDFMQDQAIVRTSSDFSESAEKLVCGAKHKINPTSRTSFRGFRIVWSPKLAQ